MKKTLLALILAVVFVLTFTLCVSAEDANENTESNEGDIILGDVNGDGEVTNADVLAIFRYIYNPERYPLPTVCNHSYGEWSVEAYASCTNDGRMTRTCTKCDMTEETIVKGGHFYEETIVPPTPADEGYTNHVCKICGNSYKDNIIPALGFTSGFAYTKNADGKTCTITGLGTVTATSVAIPEEIDGYTVTAIGEKAFENESSITEIFIPNTVKTIGTRAFYGCTGITEITIPASVTDIGTQIFYKASNLATVYYNSSYGSSSNNFLNIANIKKIVFGGSYVPSYILNGCTNIIEVVISDSVKYIYRNAFYGCTSLVSITIPDSVTSIGSYAFRGCTSLASITIPDSVTSIGSDAFRNCTSLASITIPDSVTSIGSSAFYGCTSLVSITIPDSVTSIGNFAFDGCTSLKSVYITDIEAWLNFSFSTSSSNPCYYGADLYLNGELLTSVEIPDSVTSIGNYAFYGCTSLTSIDIPDSVTSIGYYAFYGCTSLASIEIPDSVTSIGKYAFYGCSKLTSITFEDTSTWYRTTSSSYSGGTETSVTNPSTNATYFKSTYYDYYWYKE